LLGWLRVVAVREALQARRRTRREDLHDDVAIFQGSGAEANIEITLMRQRYASSFREAVEGALRCLTPEQRSLLRFHTRDGLTIDQLAPILGVHRATAARRLEKARTEVFERTRRLLREQHGLTESEARSLCRALADEVDVSIARALDDGGAR
jgi:RNA polymerase sigma-70 factor (ECF subfamily)